jgi:hypothetical protein
MGGREDWAALAGSLTITASIQLNWLAWRCPILQVGYTYHSAETFSEKHSCAGCNPRSDSVTILNRQTGCQGARFGFLSADGQGLPAATTQPETEGCPNAFAICQHRIIFSVAC